MLPTARSSATGLVPISVAVGRSPVYLCGLIGMFVGGYLPMLWGASSLSLASLAFSAIGGVAGVWCGVRLMDA